VFLYPRSACPGNCQDRRPRPFSTSDGTFYPRVPAPARLPTSVPSEPPQPTTTQVGPVRVPIHCPLNQSPATNPTLKSDFPSQILSSSPQLLTITVAPWQVGLFLRVDIRPPAQFDRTSTDRLQAASASTNSLQMDDTHSDVLSAADRSALEPTYEWSTFIKAYAAGKWDPQKTPKFPRSAMSHTTHQPNQTPQCDSIVQGMSSTVEFQSTQSVDGNALTQPLIDLHHKLNQTTSNPITLPPSSTPTPPKSLVLDPRTSKPERAQTLNVNVSHRLRESFAGLRLSSGGSSLNLGDHPHHPLDPDVLATAATIRWAGARISVAPLALPSPEHELTDPMRGVNAAIPGVHPAHGFPGSLTPEREGGLMSPGRRSRLASFWEGTVEQVLPVVDGSPSTEPAPLEEMEHSVIEDSSSASLSVVPPASVPLMASVGSETGDYFGMHVPSDDNVFEFLNDPQSIRSHLSLL
jgi:hypothetical protein